MTEVLGAVLGNHNVLFVYELFPRSELHAGFESQHDTGFKHCIVARYCLLLIFFSVRRAGR